MDLNTLIYPSLPVTETQLRLCRLTTAYEYRQLTHGPPGIISLVLQVFDIGTGDGHEYNAPPYSAVSYTWGSSALTYLVLINDQLFHVRQNLYQFLMEIVQQQGNTAQWLWIDQLCIDQSNIVERGHQVQSMARIYKNAMEVYVWLGLESEDSGLAIDLLDQDYLETEALKQRHLGAIRNLFTRPYWKRLWIVQEVVLARNLVLMCGPSRSYSSKGALSRNLWTFARQIEPNPRERCDTDPCIIRTASLLSRFDGYNMYEVIATTDIYDCSDARDQVYGVQAMVDLSQRLYPDYSMSADEVFLACIKVLARSYLSYELGDARTGRLRRAQDLRRRMKLPAMTDDELEGLLQANTVELPYKRVEYNENTLSFLRECV